MSEKVTPRVDIAFKKLFGVEENKDLLISLINSIVSEEDQIVDLDLLNPYNSKNYQKDKLSILDIKAKSHTGKRYNIEIQIADERDYDKGPLFYWAKLYTEQLERGQSYSKLNKAIGIHILNFTSIPLVEDYHNIFQLREKVNNVHHFKDIELHTIELSKFENNKKDQKLDEADELKLLLSKVKTSLDRWAAFLSRIDLLYNKKLPKELKDPQIEKALEVIKVMNFSEEEKEVYEGQLNWLRIETSALEKALDDGRTEGEAKGRAEGLVEGETKGRAEGRAERDMEIIGNMLSQGISIEIIAQSTGLMPEKIKKIKKNTQ